MANVGNFFKKTLPSMALTVAAGVPGPVGMVAQLVSSVLGKTIKPDAVSINTAIEGAAPDQVLKLRELDAQHEETMKKLGFDDLEEMARIAEQDRESARARQVAVKDKTPTMLAWVILLSFVISVLAVIRGWGKIEAAFAGTLIGYLAANANQVVSYYFGSSAGSARKTEILANGNGEGSK